MRRDKMNVISIGLASGSWTDEDKTAFKKQFRKARKNGSAIVMPIGNFGPMPGIINVMTRNNYVISVGSTDLSGKKLEEYSSRGLKGVEEYHPTVVSVGTDVLVPSPVNGSGEGITDEYIRGVSMEFWGEENTSSFDDMKKTKYSLVTGTSFASARVAGMVGRIINMKQMLGLDYTVNEIRNTLISMALPMKGYSKYEVGAGFVSPKVAMGYFASLNTREKQRTWAGISDVSELYEFSNGGSIEDNLKAYKNDNREFLDELLRIYSYMG